MGYLNNKNLVSCNSVNLFINDFKKGKIIVRNKKIEMVSKPTRDKEETKKFLSESKVLKRIYPSKKGAEKNFPLFRKGL